MVIMRIDLRFLAIAVFGAFALVSCGSPRAENGTPTPPAAVKPAEPCDRFTGAVRDACLKDRPLLKAVAARDAGGCAGVQDESKRQFCLDSIAQEKARAAQDATLCSGISNAQIRTGCEDSIYQQKAFATADPDLCAKLSDSRTRTACADQAWLKKAVAERNPRACKKLSTGSDTCLRMLGINQ
jgi:hypothetical protein